MIYHPEPPSKKHLLLQFLGVLLHQPSANSPFREHFTPKELPYPSSCSGLYPIIEQCQNIKVLAIFAQTGTKWRVLYSPDLLMELDTPPLGLHWRWLLLSSLLLPLSPFHKHLSHGNDLIDIFHIKLSLRVCFFRNPIWDTSRTTEEGRSDKVGEKMKDTKHSPPMRLIKAFKYLFNPIEIQ